MNCGRPYNCSLLHWCKSNTRKKKWCDSGTLTSLYSTLYNGTSLVECTDVYFIKIKLNVPVQPSLYCNQNLSPKQLKQSQWWHSVRLPVHLNLVLLIHSVLYILLKNSLYNEGNTLQPLADSLAQRPDIFISSCTQFSK